MSNMPVLLFIFFGGERKVPIMVFYSHPITKRQEVLKYIQESLYLNIVSRSDVGKKFNIGNYD